MRSSADARGPGFVSYVVGNPVDVVRRTQGLLVLQGGGDDVDENYVRMGALGGGGDFVVLRASGADDYNQYIYDLCKCDSVETLVFDDRQASQDPYVIETIRNAEAIFIAGGDQSRYVRFWKDSPVEDAINAVIAKPAPIGGTSAGMAVMGEFLYAANERGQPDLGGGACGSLDARRHARSRLPETAEAGRDHHGSAPARARPHRRHGHAARADRARWLDEAGQGDRSGSRDGAAR
jgi:cyanophycinase-like exopeptidase